MARILQVLSLCAGADALNAAIVHGQGVVAMAKQISRRPAIMSSSKSVSSWYDSGLRLDGSIAAVATAEATNGKIERLKREGESTVAKREQVQTAYAAAKPSSTANLAATISAAAAAQDALDAATAMANADLAEAAAADADLEKAIEDEENALTEALEAFQSLDLEAEADAMAAGNADDGNGAGAGDGEKLVQLKLEGEAAVSRRKEMQAAYKAFKPAAPAEQSESKSSAEEDAEEFVARAEARVAAREAVATALPAPATAPSPPPPGPMAVPSSSSALVKGSTLAPALVPFLDDANLLDPTTLSEDDQENALGAIGFGAFALFLLPIFEAGLLTDVFFSVLVGGGLGGYFALRKDPVGAITRDVVGDTANKVAKGTYEKAIELEEEFELTDTAKKAVAGAITDLKKKIQESL